MISSPTSLFGDQFFDIPSTEGIKYTGSKAKLLGQIINLASDLNPKRVLDGFAGTTRVSQAFAKLGWQVTSSDCAAWSKVFGQCYLQNNRPATYYQPILDYLNSLPGFDGWFTENYGGRPGHDTKKPWQIHNTRKLDAIRQEIDKLQLPEVETAVLLTSLILALDKVDNTVGHYSAYLREWSPRSYQSLKMKIPLLIENQPSFHEIIQGDIFNVISEREFDLAYFDPPYGSNNEKMPPSRVRYLAYYHIWTTVCLNDQPPIFGKAGRREDSKDTVFSSPFEDFRRDESGHYVAVQAIRRLIEQTKSKYIILSYSSGGRATSEELQEVLENSGKILKVQKIDYKKNVMATMKWTNEWLNEKQDSYQELLFLLEKSELDYKFDYQDEKQTVIGQNLVTS